LLPLQTPASGPGWGPCPASSHHPWGCGPSSLISLSYQIMHKLHPCGWSTGVTQQGLLGPLVSGSGKLLQRFASQLGSGTLWPSSDLRSDPEAPQWSGRMLLERCCVECWHYATAGWWVGVWLSSRLSSCYALPNHKSTKSWWLKPICSGYCVPTTSTLISTDNFITCISCHVPWIWASSSWWYLVCWSTSARIHSVNLLMVSSNTE
jgi:hypothetical protein